MSAPASPGRSPLRIGAFALLGVGVVAGIIGVVNLTGGGSGSSAATSTSVAVAQTAPSSNTTPPKSSSVPVPSYAAGGSTGNGGAGALPGSADATSGTAGGAGGVAGLGGEPGRIGVPGGGYGAAGGSGGAGGSATGGTGNRNVPVKDGAGVVKVPIRVYNNSTISGLAQDAAQDFRNAGWTIEEVGNYPGGIISTSTVYYRPGTDEEAAARYLAQQFGLRVQPRFPGIENATPGLIVIVTNDYRRH